MQILKKFFVSGLLIVGAFSLGNTELLFAQQSDQERVKSVEEIAAFFKNQTKVIFPDSIRKSRGVHGNYKEGQLVLSLALNFTLDSDVLNAKSKQQLDNLAAVMKSPELGQLKIELAGHTCDLGSATYNLELSRRRIESAANYLVEHHGIVADRISRRAHGEELPLIPSATTEAEREVNRRVVTYLPENRDAIEKMLAEPLYYKGFRWAMYHYRNNQQELISYDGSSVLYSNEEYRILLRPALRKYVYIFQQDSNGNGQWLFPRQGLPWSNPLKPGEYWLPNESEVFVLDENVGKETIHFVVTNEPVTELESMIDQHSSNLFTEAIEKTIKTRGLKKIRIGPRKQSGNGAAADSAKTNVIIISPGQAEPVADTDGLTLGNPNDNIARVMAQHREFYMELSFAHR